MKFIPLTVVKVNGKKVDPPEVKAFCNTRIVLPEESKDGGTYFKYEDREDLTKIYRKKYEVSEPFFTVIKLISDEVDMVSEGMKDILDSVTSQTQTLTDEQIKTLLLQNALTGDLLMSISPGAFNLSATSNAWTKEITLTLKNADGAVHSWFNGTSVASVVDTSTAGTSSIDDATPNFVNGVAKVTISGDAQSWVAAETITLTINDLSLLGYTVVGGDSVITIV